MSKAIAPVVASQDTFLLPIWGGEPLAWPLPPATEDVSSLSTVSSVADRLPFPLPSKAACCSSLASPSSAGLRLPSSGARPTGLPALGSPGAVLSVDSGSTSSGGSRHAVALVT